MSKLRKWSLGWGMGAVLLIALSGCNKNSASSMVSPQQGATGSGGFQASAISGNIVELNTTSGNSAEADVEIDDDQDMIVVLYNSVNDSNVHSFQIGEQSGKGTSLLAKNLTDGDDFEEEENDESEDDFDMTGEFHEILAAADQDLDLDAALDEENGSGTRFAVKNISVGDEEVYRVMSSFSSSGEAEKVTATVQVVRDEFYFVVDNRDLQAFDSDKLEKLADQFESVLSLESEILGEHSDVNGDGRFAVLFTRVVNKIGGSAGGIVTGFFYAVDLFDSATYPISNEKEVFYTFVPDPEGEFGTRITESFSFTNMYPSVLVHEFQHMISFNQHVLLRKGAPETGFLGEGLSHLMEDIFAADKNGYFNSTGIENPSRVKEFLNDPSNTCFVCGSSLKQRGGSYTLLRYLYEKSEEGQSIGSIDGQDFIRNLVQTKEIGKENILQAFFGDKNESFEEIMAPFSLMLYFSNTSGNKENSLQLDGLNLRAVYNDNRGTVLNGPAVKSIVGFPFVDNIRGTGVYYLEIPGKLINENQGKLKLTVQNGSNIKGYAIIPE